MSLEEYGNFGRKFASEGLVRGLNGQLVVYRSAAPTLAGDAENG